MQVKLCIEILSDVLNLLFRKDIESTFDDIWVIITTNLRTVMQAHINMDKDNPYTVRTNARFLFRLLF